MIYAIAAQVVMFITNLSILINDKFQLDFYKIYYISLPVILYTLFYVVFYISNWKMQLENEDYTVRSFVTLTSIFINLMYCVVETIIERPDDPTLYYICSVSIQFINTIVLFNIVRKSASEVTTPAGAVVLRVLNYLSLFCAVYSIYCIVFTNVMFSIIVILATSVLEMLTMFLYLIALRNQIALDMLNIADGADDYDYEADPFQYYEEYEETDDDRLYNKCCGQQ